LYCWKITILAKLNTSWQLRSKQLSQHAVNWQLSPLEKSIEACRITTVLID